MAKRTFNEASVRLRQYAGSHCEVCCEYLMARDLDSSGPAAWTVVGDRALCIECAANAKRVRVVRVSSRKAPGAQRSR